jgi:hypothetical protein
MNELKDLRVFLNRLPESIVEEYWKKYQEKGDEMEIMTDNDDSTNDCFTQDLTKPFLQEAGLNVSVIVKPNQLNSTRISKYRSFFSRQKMTKNWSN